jgi:oligopeptide/dipeptide ABC transporter ATP-binding protein
MISTALALDPHLLIADEPTTALDVTIQAQILELIEELTQHSNTAVILITHDLGVIAEMCDRVAIMYAGQLVERAQVETLFEHPLHPYTQGLMASMPILGEVKDRLKAIPGTVPDLIDMPPGCNFAPRCEARVKWGLQICEDVEPAEFSAGLDRTVRCWLYMSSGDHKATLEITETGVVEKRPAFHQKGSHG